MARLSPDHFQDPVQRTLVLLCQRYADQTRGVLPRAALEDLLRDRPPGTALMYLSYYDLAVAACPSASGFRHSVLQLRELAAIDATGKALAQGMEILRAGARDDETGEELKGHADARQHVLAAFADVERETVAGSAPEGNIRTRQEMHQVHEAYAKAKERRSKGITPGIGIGLPQVDEVLGGGLNPGELALIAGYTSSGKSQLCAQIAWYASVMQGRNVVFFTAETSRDQTKVKLVARHSRHPKFGLKHGLNSRDIRGGTLDADEYKAFQAVMSDFAGGDYGMLEIAQLRRRSTVAMLESRLSSFSRQFRPDLVIIDYLALLRPDRVRRDRREELGLILIDAAELAVTFDDGRGVPVISPWQMSREGKKAARERGGYNLNDLSETAEASNTPHVVISLLEPDADDTHGRKVPEQLDVLKNRENERYVRLNLVADFATSRFAVLDRAADESVLDTMLADEDDNLP